MNELHGKTIVLGVSGGIAAFKAPAVASLLVQSGARVLVIMTAAARQFVQPLTFSGITHNSVYTDAFVPSSPTFSGHVSLAADADCVVVAPATAATIARLALGISDDLIGLVALSTRAPILIAPAMEERMYHHPATQDHLRTLASRNVRSVGPAVGRLASGDHGEGRMVEPTEVIQAVEAILARSGALRGVKVVITAGPTQEPLDPVRFLGNRSSGRMGYALADAAVAAGARVTLVTGPTALHPPAGADVIAVKTASEMLAAVDSATRDADLLIMAAAVADYRPEESQSRKIKKENAGGSINLRLVRNPDILASVDRPDLIKIGFAAETDDLMENAARKLQTKHLAMIIANDADATIGSTHSAATILMADYTVRSLPRMPKTQLAAEIVKAAAQLVANRDHA
ncbi:MAG: bifunctional phosphopantothenoylcysteine decarboxylase/phosphopantothenate--cysteine ligase CoaBC [Chloroflexia bacterium]|nr:bifunctional phosphopantothenoylcysteine decarboxylase/phosphopantothenate--cysteine ligase CoaBC [Chloroflexia bacterium]